ncbi:MAG: dipeptidase [Desulfovibrio sp.]|uniref:dipeptidase n=1 Tax=Desulfovibrio sp. 7SRBS1 TaxID=3378064 RepID=UPI003B3D77FF
MKKISFTFAALLAFLVFFAFEAMACTTMIVTPKASKDGSMMVAHSDDDELGDQRLIYVPSKLQEGRRKVYSDAMRYPRIVTQNRGPGYVTKGYPDTVPVATVAYDDIWKILGRQQPKSYAYYDGNYGIMNEKNLMFGECTNAANYEPRYNAKPTSDSPLRIFYSAALSRIALENCESAREAIKLMGGLIDKFGYYATGETLLVADQNEAWVFEMCALPDSKYHSAWVAKRVPDGEFFVAANTFRIRKVIKKDPDHFQYSKLLIPGLKKLGWWDEDKQGPVDWLRAVSPGEYNHPYYSLRRVWRVQDRVNPDLGLSPWVKDTYSTDYPFSIKPRTKIGPRDVFSLYRDHYEGTQFDLTKGIAAGPYGDPHRFVGPYDGNQNNVDKDKKYYGAWERAVSVFYQGYTYVCQTRPYAPEASKGILWFGPDVSYTTCFVPFFPKTVQLPKAYQTGDPQKYDPQSAWWKFNLLANWSRLNFQRMTQVDIKPVQEELEAQSILGLIAMDQKIKGQPEADAMETARNFSFANAARVLQKWQDLTYTLFAKYSDGYINTPEQEETKAIGYPSDWLDKTGYADGPVTYDMK